MIKKSHKNALSFLPAGTALLYQGERQGGLLNKKVFVRFFTVKLTPTLLLSLRSVPSQNYRENLNSKTN